MGMVIMIFKGAIAFPSMEKNEWLALNAISLATSLILGFNWLFLPVYLLGLGLGREGMAFAIGLGVFAKIAVAPAIGTLNDMLGTRRLLQLSLLALSSGTYWIASIGNAPKIEEVVLPIMLFWAASTALLLSFEASIYKKSVDSQVAKHMGEYNAVKRIAVGAGVLAGGVLLLTHSFREIDFAAAAVSLAILPLTLLVKHTIEVKFSLQDYVHEIRKPGVLALSALIFIFAYEWGTENVMLAPIMSGNAGLDSAGIGAVQMVANIALAASSYFIGRKIHGLGKMAKPMMRKIVACGFLLGAAGCFLLAAASDFGTAAFARSAFNISEGIVYVSFGFLIGATFSKKYVGGANGVMNVIANASMMLASFAAGILSAGSLSLPFVVSGSFLIIGAVIAWAYLGRDK